MSGLLQGRVALVTGAGSGIGQAIATGMARAGARVVCADLNAAAAEATARDLPGGAIHAHCDVADRASCDALAARLRAETGPVAILVNNAGIVRRGKVTDEATRQHWDDTIRVNLDGPYNMVTALLDQLQETKGCVINIGSVQSFVAAPNSAAYTTSKHGVRGLTKALAIELSPMGIRVNAIGPGLIATPLNEQARKNPAYLAHFESRVPLGRIGRADDIVGPAVFLASDMAAYVTGITMPVDGGFLCY